MRCTMKKHSVQCLVHNNHPLLFLLPLRWWGTFLKPFYWLLSAQLLWTRFLLLPNQMPAGHRLKRVHHSHLWSSLYYASPPSCQIHKPTSFFSTAQWTWKVQESRILLKMALEISSDKISLNACIHALIHPSGAQAGSSHPWQWQSHASSPTPGLCCVSWIQQTISLFAAYHCL